MSSRQKSSHRKPQGRRQRPHTSRESHESDVKTTQVDDSLMFSDLGLPENLMQAIQDQGYEKPSHYGWANWNG